MKQFLIPGIPLCETLTGIPRYMYEVLTRIDNLIDNSTPFSITICYPEDMAFVNYPFKNIKIIALPRKGKKWIPQTVLPYAKNNNQTVCDMANGICLKKGTIVTIHDIRPVTQKYDPLKNRIMSRIQLQLAKMNSSVVVTVSESQKQQLAKYMPHKRIEVFPPGTSHIERFEPDFSIFNKYQEIHIGDYYYTLGSVANHKNYMWIVEVAKRNPDKQFVVAGNQNLRKWHTDFTGVNLSNIIYVGYVNDNEMRALFEKCKAYLHPSLYEGFGLPPLEAVSLGKDIAVSRIPEFLETYGNNVTFFDPRNYNFDLNAIKKMSNETRAEILEKYSWDETARRWYNLFSQQ